MALNKGSINPLNVADSRKLSFVPEHFSRMVLRNPSLDKLDAWIYQNLNSRYAIVKSLIVDTNNKMIEIHELGMEDPKELTMLSLSCPYLDRKL